MQIRSLHITDADKQSAKIFFDALFSFYDVSTGDALDMFARDGALTVSQYAYKVTNLDVWELSEQHRQKLADFRPRDLIIGDSYNTLYTCRRRYDLVVVDSPQGMHADARGALHTEHFTVMKSISNILKDRALIVLYINKRPYDAREFGSYGYDEYKEYDYKLWMDSRCRFYVGESSVISEEQAIETYRGYLEEQNFAIEDTLIIPCHSDVPGRDPYAFRLALSVARIP